MAKVNIKETVCDLGFTLVGVDTIERFYCFPELLNRRGRHVKRDFACNRGCIMCNDNSRNCE
jgi:hypothetical protein